MFTKSHYNLMLLFFAVHLDITVLSANTHQNSPADAVGNGTTNARGNANTHQNGPADSRGNGTTNARANTDQNGQADSLGNASTADKESAIVRKKRQPVLLRNSFVNSFWRALDPKTGQIRPNAAADPAGLELGENAVFAMEPSHCYEKCPCKWGNCIKLPDGPTIQKEGDECCAANHQFKCCQVPDLFPDNMKAITESLQSKCIKTVPFFPDYCEVEINCRKFGVTVYANGTKKVQRYLYDFSGCYYNRKEVEALVNKNENYFFFEHANCSRCGWALCATFNTNNKRTCTDFACKCCDYESLVASQWKIGASCKYKPENKCAVCKWKLNDDEKGVETCCNMKGLKKCFGPLFKTKECADLVKSRCECGYGICKPRQGRAANICCEEHNDLACCVEGTNTTVPTEPTDSADATVAPFKVPLLLLVLVLFVSNLAMAHILV